MATHVKSTIGALSSFRSAPVGEGIPRLTHEQLDVVTETDTDVLVDAGAGSGKTTAIVEKLLFETGCSPLISDRLMRPLAVTEVGAITFTNKAASELLERLAESFRRRADVANPGERERIAMMGHELGDARIGTIDAFASRLLVEYGPYAGFAPSANVVEHPHLLYAAVAEECLERGVLDGDAGAALLAKHFGVHAAREFLREAFARGDLLLDLGDRLRSGALRWDAVPGVELTPVDRVLEPRSTDVLTFVLGAYKTLVRRMDEREAYDHTQVLIRAARIAEDPFVQSSIRNQLKLLVVDEFQDTSLVQCRLLFRLAGLVDAVTDFGDERGAKVPCERPELRLVLVGDAKQSIYAFRGADVTLWDASRRLVRARGGRCLRLSENYRSRPAVLRFCDSTLGRIMPTSKPRSRFDVPYRALVAGRRETPGQGAELLLADRPGAQQVAEAVADRVAEMLRSPHTHTVCDQLGDGVEFPRSVRPRDIAILARTLRGAVEHYERAFRDRGIPYRVLGGHSLFAQSEVRDLALFLRALADTSNSLDLVAFLRSPLGHVDDVTIAQLAAAAGVDARGVAAAPIETALSRAAEVIRDPVRAARATQAWELLARMRPHIDRVPHADLVEEVIRETAYEAFLAAAPDPIVAQLNVRRFLQWLRKRHYAPLRQLGAELEGRMKYRDFDEELATEPDVGDVVTISTIHKAKGLEWPVVIVTGLDEPFVRAVRRDRPRLDAQFGVTLPLDLAVVGDDGTDQLVEGESSAIWQRHRQNALQREYAEAKRIFYVACTRARDRLILAGALQSSPHPRALDPDQEFLHRDGPERWLRYLYPEISRSNRRTQVVPIPASTGDDVREANAGTLHVRRSKR